MTSIPGFIKVSASDALRRAIADPSVSIRSSSLLSPDFGLPNPTYYCAEIDQQIHAHVHEHGDEFYHIVSGSGQLFLSKVVFSARGAAPTSWHVVDVNAGDLFVIPAGVAHSLRSSGGKPLELHFMCSPRHMIDIEEGGDRWLVENP